MENHTYKLNTAHILASIAAVFFALAPVAHAEVKTLTCNGAEIKIDFPPDINDLVRADPDSCTFWKDTENPDYSGYYFGGSVRIEKNGDKKPYAYQTARYPKDGTWNNLLSKKQIFVFDSDKKYIRIDEGNFKSKFLAKISPSEEDEKIEFITRINGKIFSNGVWVNVGLALPYKSLTKQQAVDLIKSVEIVKGFDAANE